MAIDVQAVRRQTRGVQNVTHLNHAGSSLVSRPVAETVMGHLRREEEIGGYEAAEEAADRLENVYLSVARLIGAQPNEIALAESGSRAWGTAVYSFPFELRETGSDWPYGVFGQRRRPAAACAST
jgi:cysteine desulfurase/selenocysteine lyase